MRWIFYSVLLANLVFLGINLWGGGIAGLTQDKANIRSVGEAGRERAATRILLVSEADQALGKKRPESPNVQPALVDTTDALSCLGLGPFENVISAQDVAERLEAIGHAVALTAIDTPTGASDFRVVMPPLSSLQEAFRKLREFKSRDIDSYVITQGEDAQGISLGVFSSNSAAADYRQEMQSLGYEVLIKVIPRVNRGYWVQIDQEPFPESFLSELSVQYSGVEVTETACKDG